MPTRASLPVLGTWPAILTVTIAGAVLATPAPTAVKLVALIGAAMAAFAGQIDVGAITVALALPLWMITIHVGSTEWGYLELALLLSAIALAGQILRSIDWRKPLGSVGGFLPAWSVMALAVSLVAIAVLSLGWVADIGHRGDSARALRRVVVEPLFVVPAVVWAIHQLRQRLFGVALAIPAVWVSILALGQFISDRSTVTIGGVGRPIGPFTHPNNLAFYLERAIWFVPLANIGLRWIGPRQISIATGIVLAGVVATLSRGAAIGLVVGGAIYFWEEIRHRIRLLIPVGATLLAIAFGARLASSSGDSVSSREAIWRSSLDMLRDHPWKGLGLDQFLGEYGRRYVRREGWDERYTSHPHNVLLDFWLSLGIGGVIWLWAALEVGANRIMVLLRTGKRGVPRAGAAMLCAGLAHGLLDNSFFLPDLATWTWIGLVLISTPEAEPTT